MAKARRTAVTQGLDPDKWFNNVAIVVARQIGTETTTYARAEAEKARRQVAPSKS